MSEENKNASQSNKGKNKKSKKKLIILPYIYKPIIFVIISLIFIVPICKVALDFAVQTVHSAQNVFVKDNYDFDVIDDFKADNRDGGFFDPPTLYHNEKIGELSCDAIGLKSDVYYCINRVTMRNGIAMSAQSRLCGQGGAVNLAGYSSTILKPIANVKNGDIIKIVTSWGAFEYEVYDIQNMNNTRLQERLDENDETLVISTSNDDKAFSAFDSNKKYVLAKIISGPIVKEAAV